MVYFGRVARSKKTVSDIVESDNHYCIGLKGNQPKLLAQAQRCETTDIPVSVFDAVVDCSHGRLVERCVQVFEVSQDCSEDWANLAAFASVKRFGVRDGHSFQTQSWFILDQCLSAQRVAQLVQNHRGTIENRVHWVKDVVQREDASLIQAANPATVMSIFRSWAISIFRKSGYDSITRAIRFFRHDLPKLISFF